MEGHTNKEIAGIVDVNEHTVSDYIYAYDTGGIEGLIPKKSPGRPKRLTDEQEQMFYDTISNHTPDEVGFDGIMNWTAKIARLWVIREYRIEYTVNGILELFHRLNLSYTRPTYVLAKADPEKQKQFKEDFDRVKKTSE
jgi:putative transposase